MRRLPAVRPAKPNFTCFSHRGQVKVMSGFFKEILCNYCIKAVKK